MPGPTERDVRRYIELELGGPKQPVKFRHFRRVKSGYVDGERVDVYECLTQFGRHWVVGGFGSLALYDESEVATSDAAFTYHVGSSVVAAAQSRHRLSSDSFSPAYRLFQQAVNDHETAEEAVQYQAVGNHLRESLVALAKELGTPQVVPAGQEAPKRSDFKAWADFIANHALPGPSNSHRRSLLKGLSDETWRYVSWLVHAKNATRSDSSFALAAARLAFELLTAAARLGHAQVDRCPQCASYRLTSEYRRELVPIDREGFNPHVDPYVLLCEVCKWEQPKKPLPMESQAYPDHP